MFKWVKKMLDQIAKVNDETFKGQKLDCCDMNRKNNAGKK